MNEAKSPIHGLRFHDLRHHAITELAESQASDQTIMSIAGHVSAKMLGHYSHVRLDAKRKALDGLSGGGSGVGYDTKHDINSASHSNANSQVIQNIGGRDRDRTGDLLVANEALSQLSYSPTEGTTAGSSIIRQQRRIFHFRQPRADLLLTILTEESALLPRRCLRNLAGGPLYSRLNARLNAASEP